MFTVIQYCPEKKLEWDQFLTSSKNGHFMFHRDYMEYHADRFKDMSLMIYEDSSLIALLPGNVAKGVFYSHQGLTFGGIISDERMKTARMQCVFQTILEHLKAQNIERLIYKAVPYIYHRCPAQEDLYTLYRFGAKLYRADVSTTIDLSARIDISERRKRSLKKAIKAGVEIRETQDFTTYIDMLNAILQSKYQTLATHTAQELGFLNKKFPKNIRLFAAYQGEKMLAGVVTFETQIVMHAQYIAASEQGKTCGALDAVFAHLINNMCIEKRYFDFGISTEEQGRYLNEGLIQQKEEFGGRAIIHQFFEVNING